MLLLVILQQPRRSSFCASSAKKRLPRNRRACPTIILILMWGGGGSCLRCQKRLPTNRHSCPTTCSEVGGGGGGTKSFCRTIRGAPLLTLEKKQKKQSTPAFVSFSIRTYRLFVQAFGDAVPYTTAAPFQDSERASYALITVVVSAKSFAC